MKICLCGCGQETRTRWVSGHQFRGRAKVGGETSQVSLEPNPIELFIAEEQADISAKVVADSPALPQAESVATPAPLKVHIFPEISENERGGIPRVIEAQLKYLPKFGIEITDAASADVIAYHVECPKSYVNLYPRKTFVSIVHGAYWSEIEGWGNWEMKANANLMEGIRISDASITCSEWVANSLRRHTSRDVRVINHGVDYDDWQSALKPRDYVLWNKTRPDPVCDPEPMNQVAALLPDTKFISTFGKETNNIVLTGSLPYQDAKKLVQQAGVYLCTTRETFGIGTLEALACGVPVVGFKWGGQAEFIEHGVDGWLVTPGDIQGLATGIKWALANREVLASRCRAKAKLYNWERICSEYADIFKEAHASKNKTGPRTSIIVTAYKLGQYLPSCLDSCLGQSDPDWECIIVDDASPDDCGRISDAYAAKDSRFRVIHNEKNVYLAEARNIGIRMARGRYILPLDADDMLAPDAVAVLGDSLDSDRSIQAAYGGVFFVNEDGVTPTIFEGSRTAPGKSGWPVQFAHEKQIQQMNLLPYASMYRREAWEKTGGYRRRCRTAEDADMWTRFSSYGYRPKMVTEADTLIYRIRSDSMSAQQGGTEWIRWFSWSKMPEITPAGAGTKEQLPIPSLDPVIVSVIIPVGPGHEKLVTDAVDSVDSQSFRGWECIVINDTGHPLATELPSWVKVISTEGNTGPGNARNVGIKASKGRFFLPLDADDYLEPDAIQMMLNAGVESGFQDVIYPDFWDDAEGPGILKKFSFKDYDARLLKRGCLHSVTALTPKLAWEKVGGYDESLSAWEDWDFQLKLADKGICSRRVDMPLFVYRKHTGFRREENFASFESSKEAILRKWGALWEGGKELMACGSCGGRQTFRPNPSNFGVQAPKLNMNNGEAVLVRYTGQKRGATPYRGPSRTMYFFGFGDTKYVLAEDIKLFLSYPDEFEIVAPEPEKPAEEEKPLLVAAGPPSQ